VAARSEAPRDARGHEVDDYYWMHEREDPKVRAYLEAENAYAEALMKPTEKLRARLYMSGRPAEARGRAPPSKTTVTSIGLGTSAGRSTRSTPQEGLGRGPPRTVLDVNVLAAGRSCAKTSGLAVSPDNRWPPWRGHPWRQLYTIRIRDSALARCSRTQFPDRGRHRVGGPTAGRFFYTTRDVSLRTYRVGATSSGRPGFRRARLPGERSDFEVRCACRVARWCSRNLERGLVRVALRRGDRSSGLEVFKLAHPGLRMGRARGGRFWIRTNLDAPNFRSGGVGREDAKEA